MELETKKLLLSKLFLSFPSASRMDSMAVASMTAAYLEILHSVSSDTLSKACDTFRRKASAFPPSSGEIYSECCEIDDRRRRLSEPVRQPAKRLPPPSRNDFTLDELADFGRRINGLSGQYTMRVDRNGNPLTIPSGFPGEGTPTFYGYLTPKEIAP